MNGNINNPNEIPNVILWMYVQLMNHKHHLQIQFIELIEKNEINHKYGIHYITNDNNEHFLMDGIT